MPMNPYADLPAERFWRKAVAGLPPFAIAPRNFDAFTIGPDDLVATAGSCFAQHVARALRDAGFRYHITEPAPKDLPADEALAQNYGVYSARYGNVYTTRQLVQLFDRAYGRFTPALTSWTRPDGRFVDPFRPAITPQGFGSEAEVVAAREAHFAEVRRLFETLDVFVFTLGLTEGWRHRADGAALQMAPGVVGGSFDPREYEFVNARVGDMAADLSGFLERLGSVNPGCRAILTVSPVPIIATYEDRHVLVSNCYSKSALRVAAEEACLADPRAVYFPGYELVANNATRYYTENLRAVSEAGVRHVMRVFLETFTDRRETGPGPGTLATEFESAGGVVCDEEAIERSLV